MCRVISCKRVNAQCNGFIFCERKYGIKRPDDALRVVERIINSPRDNEDKAYNLRPIIGWLNKLDIEFRKQYGIKLRSIEVKI